MASTRRAISFDKDLYSYIENIAKIRDVPFAAVCNSMLMEIMRDDLASERGKNET